MSQEKYKIFMATDGSAASKEAFKVICLNPANFSHHAITGLFSSRAYQ